MLIKSDRYWLLRPRHEVIVVPILDSLRKIKEKHKKKQGTSRWALFLIHQQRGEDGASYGGRRYRQVYSTPYSFWGSFATLFWLARSMSAIWNILTDQVLMDEQTSLPDSAKTFLLIGREDLAVSDPQSRIATKPSIPTTKYPEQLFFADAFLGKRKNKKKRF